MSGKTLLQALSADLPQALQFLADLERWRVVVGGQLPPLDGLCFQAIAAVRLLLADDLWQKVDYEGLVVRCFDYELQMQ